MKKPYKWFFLFFLLVSMTACGQPNSEHRITKVGLLVPDSINDQVWGTKGYKGMLQIQSELGVDIFYKEGIVSELATRQVVDDFVKKDVNLVFGHSSEYAPIFNNIAKDYPDVHFVCFNGDVRGKNVTSLNFKGNAMGFFGGMVAGEMTKTNKVGIIAAFEWQPEINGFYEGASFQNHSVDVEIDYVEDWNDDKRAISILNNMIDKGVDVIYPAGDGYNVHVIEKVKEKGLYAIGYISDQSDLGEGTVLTSTIQQVDKLYLLVAKKFNKGELNAGNLYFDFEDGVISMGELSSNIDDDFVKEFKKAIHTYKETGDLPNQ
ncbi:BMP family ABC transporter substrate-binding protein [Fredinandcohnia quinoae]|uniref:BMP family ABC transporter substrate-binding protein n=1 Tax=Fredinandcohnia quinoae TaxID=2918902 RepID=A0AAW5E3Q6_9BACI|nr:BMP family ABC transporter substrate-binding protein [Fredinandcohnia sp. SECRCQ15]MCH1625880.1 BMP family ABC transporter substrate-binding protein [Fredinandcohnia sp. SECRCQ15]